MGQDFENHPFFSTAFLLFLVLCSFFGAPLFYMPVLPLLALSTTLHDRYVDFWIGTWFQSVAGFLELLYGTKVTVTGDRFPKKDNCVILMNHRTQMDWILQWSFLARRGNIGANKISLKNSLRYFPGAGWAMQQALFLFLRRNWENDKLHFHRYLNYFVDTKRPIQLLIFPEGTDFCENTKNHSDAFAKKNDLQVYEHVLHPRTRGFAEAVGILRRRGTVKSVLDITVGYPVNTPEGLRSLVKGNYPHQVHFDVKCHSIESLPEESDALQDWCKRLWAEKEKRLGDFYQKGKFLGEVLLDDAGLKKRLLKWLVFWLLVTIGATFLFVVSSTYRWFVLLSFSVYGLMTFLGGVERVVLAAHDRLTNAI